MMFCQKCLGSLRVDDSLHDLNPAAFDILLSTAQPEDKPVSTVDVSATKSGEERLALYKASKASVPALSKRPGPSRQSTGKLQAVLPPVSDNSHGQGSSEMERQVKLFEIISSRSDVDHPICTDCTNIILKSLAKKRDSCIRERDIYLAYIKQQQANAPSDEEARNIRAAMEEAQEMERTAHAKLLSAEEESSKLEEELATLIAKERRQEEEENAFWRKHNATSALIDELQAKKDSIKSKLEHDKALLARLERSNVFNDTFRIRHDGAFGTINGLRLGKYDSSRNAHVDWPEINAAWGCALHLIVTVAERLNCRFEGYNPKPMGSTSRIVRIEQASPANSRSTSARGLQSFLPPLPAPKHTTLELFYSTENLNFGRMFSRGRFGDAMVAFLELMRQLAVHINKMSRERLQFPYTIKGDKIGDASIRLAIGQDEAWTRACKSTLTYCKFLLMFASNMWTSNARET